MFKFIIEEKFILKELIKTHHTRINNFATLLLANAFTSGIGFLTTITIANTLGSVLFGQLAYAMAIGGVLAANVRFGMDRSLIRELVQFPERFNETLAASMVARASLLFVCVTVLLFLKVLPIETFEISWGMFLVILGTALDPLQITNVFDVWERQGRDALYICVQKGLYFLLIWGVFFLSPNYLGLNWIGSSLLIAVLLLLFLQYRYAWSRLKPTLSRPPFRKIYCTAFDLMKSNKWLWLASLSALGMTALNSVALKHIAGFADLGTYAASFQLVSLGALLLKNIARIGRPVLARYIIPGKNKFQATGRILTLYMALCFAVVGCIALPVVLYPKVILEVLFTAEFTDSFWVLRIFGFYLMLRVFDTVLGQYIVLMRADKLYFASLVTSGFFTFGSCLVLAPFYEAVGAAIALLIGELILVASYIFMTLSLLKRYCN